MAPRFESLPHAIQLRIFVLLPLDTRLRCVEVCRAWRLALQDAAAWRHVVMPDFAGSRVDPEVVARAALARSHGEIETLDLSTTALHPPFCGPHGGRQLCTPT